MLNTALPTSETSFDERTEKPETSGNGSGSNGSREKQPVERLVIEKAKAELRRSMESVRDEFGGIAMERVFPSMQPDIEIIEEFENGRPVKNRVTREDVTLEEYATYFTLPSGITVSKAAKSIYFPPYTNGKITQLTLESESSQLKRRASSEGFGVAQVAIIPTQGEAARHEKLSIGEQQPEPTDEEEIKQTPMTISEPSLTAEGDLPNPSDELKSRMTGEGRSRIYAEDLDETEPTMRYPGTGATASRYQRPEEGMDMPLPTHPETLSPTFEVVELENEGTFPLLTEVPYWNLKKTCYRQIEQALNMDKFGDGLRMGIHHEDTLFEMYNPRLISPDLIILENKDSGDYVVFAKGKDIGTITSDPSTSIETNNWIPKEFGKVNSEEEIQNWLFSLDDSKGGPKTGFNSRIFETVTKEVKA